MSKRVRYILIVLSALVLVLSGVFATLAYLNDTTDEVKNTISVGDVKIKLDEAPVSIDEYGQVTTGTGRVLQNHYNLVPGMTYPKDPTVHVAADSEPAYIFVKIQNSIADVEVAVDPDGDPAVGKISEQILANGWEKVAGYDDLYVYNGTQKVAGKDYIVSTKDAAQKDLVIFQQFKVNPDLDFEANGELPALQDLNGKTIQVKAYAIQAYGLSMTDAAEMADEALVFTANQY